MAEFYKLYIGSYVKEGKPTTWTIASTVPRKGLIKAIKELSTSLKYGMELYILTPSGEIKAFYRENISQFLS